MARPPRPISEDDHQLLGKLAGMAESLRLIEAERESLVVEAKGRRIPQHRISEAAEMSIHKVRNLPSE